MVDWQSDSSIDKCYFLHRSRSLRRYCRLGGLITWSVITVRKQTRQWPRYKRIIDLSTAREHRICNTLTPRHNDRHFVGDFLAKKFLIEIQISRKFVPTDQITMHHWLFITWWRHEMETFFALLAICAGNSPVPGVFHAQRPVTPSFDVFFDLRLNKRLSKQSWGWWFESPSRPLWRHRNVACCRTGDKLLSEPIMT